MFRWHGFGIRGDFGKEIGKNSSLSGSHELCDISFSGIVGITDL